MACLAICYIFVSACNILNHINCNHIILSTCQSFSLPTKKKKKKKKPLADFDAEPVDGNKDAPANDVTTTEPDSTSANQGANDADDFDGI